VEGTYRPGDVIELQAEMRRAEYAELSLHVPAHAQLHFVAHTREPVRYVEGEYVQRELLLLQPMNAGVFELSAITATLEHSGAVTEVPLPPVQFTVDSYAAVDASQEAAALGVNASVPPQSSNLVGMIVGVVLLLCLLVWFLARKAKVKPLESTESVVGLSDLITVLEAGESGSALIEHLLERTDLSLSPFLRQDLEAAAYADRIDVAALLQQLKEEVSR
jgi:hypothetical protein